MKSSAKNLSLLAVIPLLALIAFWYMPQVLGTETPLALTHVDESTLSESTGEWWLVSGGIASLKDGHISTILGDLDAGNSWRKSYLRKNPLDTDNGFHPQNIFFLATRSEHFAPVSQVYFNVLKTNLSPSPNRNEFNGVYLVSRYQDVSNFYLAGLSVDGRAIIRKKVGGIYSVLVEEPIFTTVEYDKDTQPNLIPSNAWIGLRSNLREEDGRVRITLEGDLRGTGEWKVLAEAIDNGVIVEGSGHSGLKSDFMDVKYTGYKVEDK